MLNWLGYDLRPVQNPDGFYMVDRATNTIASQTFTHEPGSGPGIRRVFMQLLAWALVLEGNKLLSAEEQDAIARALADTQKQLDALKTKPLAPVLPALNEAEALDDVYWPEEVGE